MDGERDCGATRRMELTPVDAVVSTELDLHAYKPRWLFAWFSFDLMRLLKEKKQKTERQSK